MMHIEGDVRINLVIGDDLTYWIGVDEGMELIDKVEFICSDLSIDEYMENMVFSNSLPEKTGYSLVISHTTTEGYSAGMYKYSVKLTDIAGTIRTIVYEEELRVLPKEATA